MFWRTMFAFQNWHSALEMKLYAHRFLHLMDGLNDMTSLVFPKYNQYDSFVRPLMTWLKEQGVNIQYDTIVTDLELELDVSGEAQTATAIRCHTGGGDHTIRLGARDMVFITTGSIVEDTAYGDGDTVPELTVNKEDPAVGASWQLWENLARKSTAFGRPGKFSGNVPASTWESATLTCKASPLMEKLKELSVNDPSSGNTVTGGVITFTDSAWLMSFTVNRQPHFPDQSKDLVVIWVYALLMDKPGDHIKKPMPECTGNEILAEMCFHLGLIDQVEEITAATKVRTALMPYITAQFMPRASGDRPRVVPKGATNIACLGQFVETNNDVVFTLESSVRTARIGVYSLLGVKKQVPDIYPGQYDIRRILRATRTLNSDEPFVGEGLLRRFLGGTYFENILPLGPDEQPADLRKPSLFERERRAVLDLIEKSETLDGMKNWFQGKLESLRDRR
jgi:oleate hydratase